MPGHNAGIHPQKAAAPVKLLLTPQEAAQALGIGRTVLYQLLTRKDIRSFKLGAARRIPLSALQEFIERQIEQEAC
jgi:excisionase family DNA binding protein